MPLPKPNDNETQEHFHGRCMGDPTMIREFPDQEQRNAVCYGQWDKRHNKAKLAYFQERIKRWLREQGHTVD